MNGERANWLRLVLDYVEATKQLGVASNWGGELDDAVSGLNDYLNQFDLSN